jgi:hypothetical protein
MPGAQAVINGNLPVPPVAFTRSSTRRVPVNNFPPEIAWQFPGMRHRKSRDYFLGLADCYFCRNRLGASFLTTKL